MWSLGVAKFKEGVLFAPPQTPYFFSNLRARSLDIIIRIVHANFGVNRLKSLKARAASVKHKYYANFTINCHLKLIQANVQHLLEIIYK